MFELGCPVVIALNKVDRLKPGHIAEQMKTAAALGDFHALHPVSAKTGDGIDELRSDLVSLLPEGPMLYPDGEVTDMPLEARIAELVREQALRLTREEVPHALTAEVVEIEDGRVHVRLYTETESQKQILIGKGGSMVREIGRRRAPGHRGAARPQDLPRAPGEGLAEVAAQRDDARAARAVALAFRDSDDGRPGRRRRPGARVDGDEVRSGLRQPIGDGEGHRAPCRSPARSGTGSDAEPPSPTCTP